MKTSIRKRGFGRAKMLSAAVGLSVVTALVGCTGANPGGSSADTASLTIAVPIGPISYTLEGLGTGGPLQQLWQPVADTLLRHEDDGTISPNAASEFEWNSDNTVLTLTIRSGMEFTDGNPVDAAAVRACLERNRDSFGPAALNLAGAVIDDPDSSTVTITLPQPNQLLTQYLSSSTGALLSPAAFTAEDAATNPVGSGPYTIDLDASTSGSVYTFVRNPDYWNKEAFPYEEIVFKVLADPTATLSALRSGQIQAASMDPATAAAAESAGFTVLEQSTSWSGIIIADRDGTVVPALADVRVRQAINMVFDREAIAENLFLGAATPTEQVFNPSSDLYDPSLNETYALDVAAAQELMAEAGYADGFDVNMPDIPGLSNGLPLAIQQLALLNIRVIPDSVTAQQGFPDMLAGRWAMIQMDVASSSPISDAYGAISPLSFYNPLHSIDPELFALLDTAQRTTGSEQEEALKDINTALVEKAWFAPWANATSFYVLDKDVTASLAVGDASVPVWNFAPKS